jgi:uncharacterized protein DUF6788
MASHPRLEQQRTVAGLPRTGSLQREWRRCGKPTCRCAGGMLHGPYWYLRWRDRGSQASRARLVACVGAQSKRDRNEASKIATSPSKMSW